MQKMSYRDIVNDFLGQAVYMLQARFDLLTPKWKDYFARELIRWLETHLTKCTVIGVIPSCPICGSTDNTHLTEPHRLTGTPRMKLETPEP